MIKNLQDTTASRVAKLLAELRDDEGLLTLSRVATLVIVTEADALDDPIKAAVRASHEHPARIIVIIADPDAEHDQLDAELRVGSEAGAGEIIVLHANGRVTSGLDTLITPLLLPDAPIVTWWPYETPASPIQDALGSIAQRRITDVLHCCSPEDTMLRLARGYSAGDSDLSWSRITNWRGLVATAFEHPPVSTPTSVTIEGKGNNPSVILMKAWLEHSLPKTRVEVKEEDGEHGLMGVVLHRTDGNIALRREDRESVSMTLPGRGEAKEVTMPKRTMYDLLSEELRRLDPDEIYGEVLAQAFPINEDPSTFARSKPEPTTSLSTSVDDVVKAVSKNTVQRIEQAIEERGVAHLVLTGGRAGTAAAERIAINLEVADVDTSKLHVWWGDERFVPSKSSDRNDRPVLSALTTGAGIPVYNVHTMPAADVGMSLDEAAAWYSQQLSIYGGDAAFSSDDSAFFDVLLLGVGPDGHVASLFPHHEDALPTAHYAVPVRHSPKPPSERISLSWSALNSSRHVAFIVAGEDKAEAVARAHGDIDAVTCPASAVRGLESTTWYVDQAAAGSLE